MFPTQTLTVEAEQTWSVLGDLWRKGAGRDVITPLGTTVRVSSGGLPLVVFSALIFEEGATIMLGI